jgi:hypothetical protein
MVNFREYLSESKLANVDPHKLKAQTGLYLGAAAISLTRDVSIPEFILNGTGDGWFRRIEGNSKGYGLAIRSIKLTSKKDTLSGENTNYSRYLVKVAYVDFNDDEKMETANGWLWVYNNFTLEEVLKYIDEHKAKWVP